MAFISARASHLPMRRRKARAHRSRGITAGERANFAEAQVRAIFARYAPLLSDDPAHLQIAAAPASEPGLFQVTVRYDLSDRNFSRFSGLFPLPSEQPQATVIAANGGY